MWYNVYRVKKEKKTFESEVKKMNVKEFVKVSYMGMLFRDYKTRDLIYNFQWNDDVGEEQFIDEYGYCKVICFKGHCDGVLDVFINSEV